VMSLILHRTLPLSTETTAAAHGASRSALYALCMPGYPRLSPVPR
jgi:hypothetical protein